MLARNYEIVLEDGNCLLINCEDEDDWGNVQHCFTDYDGVSHRECVGWGSADDWKEIVSVVDCENDARLNPLDWAKNRILPFASCYAL